MDSLKKLKEKLAGIVREFPNSYSAKIKSDAETLHAVYSCTAFLPEYVKLKTRVYQILNDLGVRPACAHCGTPLITRDIKNLREGYRKYCSPKCAKDSDARKAAFKKTCEERYGAENPSSVERFKEKKRRTCLMNLGVDNPAKSKAVLGKIAETNLARYGCPCALHSEEGAAKTAATIKKRYGVTSFSKTAEFIEKTTAANRARFGVDFPNQDPRFRRTSQKRYTYKGIGFDSSPELAFFIYAEDRGLDVEYQPDVRFEYLSKGKKYRYQPDFRIGSAYIEIKGLQFFENKDPAGRMINPYDRSMDEIYEAKHQCMVENGVKIMLPSEYNKYVKYVKKTYGDGYLRKFKN